MPQTVAETMSAARYFGSTLRRLSSRNSAVNSWATMTSDSKL